MPVQVLKQENNKSIFISYAHQDKKYKDMLEEHLSVAKFYGLRTWTDEQISVGDTWKNEIISAINESFACILLISRNFFSSKFIMDEEVPRIFKQRTLSGKLILPLLVGYCDWQGVPWIAELQLRPVGAVPLATLTQPRRDKALTEFVQEIRQKDWNNHGPTTNIDTSEYIDIELVFEGNFAEYDDDKIYDIIKKIRDHTETGDNIIIKNVKSGSIKFEILINYRDALIILEKFKNELIYIKPNIIGVSIHARKYIGKSPDCDEGDDEKILHAMNNSPYGEEVVLGRDGRFVIDRVEVGGESSFLIAKQRVENVIAEFMEVDKRNNFFSSLETELVRLAAILDEHAKWPLGIYEGLIQAVRNIDKKVVDGTLPEEDARVVSLRTRLENAASDILQNDSQVQDTVRFRASMKFEAMSAAEQDHYLALMEFLAENSEAKLAGEIRSDAATATDPNADQESQKDARYRSGSRAIRGGDYRGKLKKGAEVARDGKSIWDFLTTIYTWFT